MNPLKFDIPVRKKGYKSPEEVEKREKEIISLFKDEKDKKTFRELLEIAKKKGWRKTSAWRYLQKMVKERKVIKEGKGRGAVYRCNLVELMQLDHFAYLGKIREFCSKKELSLFYDRGSVNCTILGIPSDGLTDYEQLVARAIVEKLSSSWLLLYGLRGTISLRLLAKREVADFYTTLSLYEHDFHKILSNILKQPKMFRQPKMIRDLFRFLMESMISWTRKTGLPDTLCSFDPVIRKYDLEEVDRVTEYPHFKLEDKDLKLFAEELLALTITGNMMESKEFWQCIENWLKFYLLDFFETAKRYNFNKAQEIGEVVLEIFKTVCLRRFYLRPGPTPLVLKKERLLNWNLLLNRYGEENTKVILDLVEEATSRYARKEDKIDAQHWIMEKTHSYLREQGLIDQYVKEKFYGTS